GCLPLIVSIILAAAPDLTVSTVGTAVAVTLGGFAFIFALLYAACLPWGVDAILQDPAQPWHQRLLIFPSSPLFISGFLWVTLWLWPWEIRPAIQTKGLIIFLIVIALVWQIYGVLKVGNDSRLAWGATIFALPVLGAASSFWLRFSQPCLSAALTYFGLAAAVLMSMFCLRHFKIINA